MTSEPKVITNRKDKDRKSWKFKTERAEFERTLKELHDSIEVIKGAALVGIMLLFGIFLALVF